MPRQRIPESACSHTGSQLCARCSWQRPPEAAALVLRGRTARKAAPVAAVVGTVLSLVNQGSVIFGGTATATTWLRVGVNYLVPFLVASFGYLGGRRVRAAGRQWRSYLAYFHDEQPAITERVLENARHRSSPAPYAWLAQALQQSEGPILDLACGSAPTRPLLPARDWLGVDFSAGELAVAAAAGRLPLVRGEADRLPVADGSVSVVGAAMCLPLLTPLDAVLAEVRRVLQPGGQLVALVPSGLVAPRRGLLGWVRVLRALGLRRLPWPNPEACDGLGKVLRAHGFVIDSDMRRVYRRELTDQGDAELVVDSLYLPDVDSGRVRDAKRSLAHWARAGRTLPLPLRRVVSHLPQDTSARRC